MTDSDDATAESSSTLGDVSWRRVANVAALILLIAVAAPFVVHAVPQVVGADHSYVVTSGSMEPVMSPGDVIVVNSVAAGSIEEGDVITYGASGDGLPTTHRVVDVTQQDGALAFETKGDANEDPDGSLVTPDEIQGRVMSVGGYLFVIPLVGYVIDFAGTPVGFVALFAIPVGLLVLGEIRDFVVATRSDGRSDDGTAAEPDQPDASDAGGAEPDQPDAPAPEERGGGTGADQQDAPTPEDGGTGRGTATAAAGSPDGDPAGVESGDGGSNDEGITFTAAELQLGLFVLVAFLAYSVWVSYRTTEIWAFGVMGGVGAALLLLGGLYLFGGGGSGAGTDESDGPGSPPDPESGSPAPAASETLAPDEDGGREHGADAGPDVEPELLEDIIQRTDGGDPAAERLEEVLLEGVSSSENDVLLEDTSGSEGAEESSGAGFEFLDRDPDGERERDADRTPDVDDATSESEHDE
jgi:signal peptidase